jgi:hypothetical protein
MHGITIIIAIIAIIAIIMFLVILVIWPYVAINRIYRKITTGEWKHPSD